MVKVAAVGLLILVAALFVITAEDWSSLPQIVTRATIPAQQLGFAVLLGALAFAGAGGGQNLCQSNWIRDKGFGMGKYVPHIKSPITGELEAAPRPPATCSSPRPRTSTGGSGGGASPMSSSSRPSCSSPS